MEKEGSAVKTAGPSFFRSAQVLIFALALSFQQTPTAASKMGRNAPHF